MYLIIKHYERFALNVPGIPDSWPRWAKITAGTVKENHRTIPRVRLKTLTREQARALIKEGGLVEVFRNRSGIVYDTPDKAFYKKYHGAIDVPRMLGAE